MRFKDYIRPFLKSMFTIPQGIIHELQNENFRGFIPIFGIGIIILGIWLLLFGNETTIHSLIAIVIGFLITSGYVYSADFNWKPVIVITSVWGFLIISFLLRLNNYHADASRFLIVALIFIVGLRFYSGKHTFWAREIGKPSLNNYHDLKLNQVSNDFYLILGLSLLTPSAINMSVLDSPLLNLSTPSGITGLIEVIIEFVVGTGIYVIYDTIYTGYINPITLFVLGAISIWRASSTEEYTPNRLSYLTPLALLLVAGAFGLRIIVTLAIPPGGGVAYYIIDLVFFAVAFIAFGLKSDTEIKKAISKKY